MASVYQRGWNEDKKFFSPGLEGMGVGMNLCEDGW